MSRYVARIGLVISLLMISMSNAHAQNPASFKAAVGEIGTESYAFGVELWALSEIQLLPDHDLRIEAIEVASEADRLALLRQGRTHFAVIEGEVPASDAVELRSVIAYRPQGAKGSGANRLTRLVTRADVPSEVVYRITGVVFDHATYLSGNTPRAGIDTLKRAIEGLSLPVHQGAIKFYENRAEGFRSVVATNIGETSEADLNADEAMQLREACLAAIGQGQAAHFVGNGNGAPCDAAWLSSSLIEQPQGQGGPMTPVGLRGKSDWSNPGSAAPLLDTLALQPTM